MESEFKYLGMAFSGDDKLVNALEEKKKDIADVTCFQ